MPYNDTLFRQQFPEFGDTSKYPAGVLQVSYGMASQFIDSNDSPYKMLNGDALVLALNYMTAHIVGLGINNAASMSGKNPSVSQGGFETSASIDKISVSKVAPPAKDAWGYWLGQTSYGQALQALLSVLGVGGFSVGGLPEGDAFRRVGGYFPGGTNHGWLF